MATAANQGVGSVERIFYVLAGAFVVRYGPKLGLSEQDAPWLAEGLLAAIAGIIGWIHNRPDGLLSRGAAALPADTRVVLVPSPDATPKEMAQVQAIAAASSDKVSAAPL